MTTTKTKLIPSGALVCRLAEALGLPVYLGPMPFDSSKVLVEFVETDRTTHWIMRRSVRTMVYICPYGCCEMTRAGAPQSIEEAVKKFNDLVDQHERL